MSIVKRQELDAQKVQSLAKNMTSSNDVCLSLPAHRLPVGRQGKRAFYFTADDTETLFELLRA